MIWDGFGKFRWGFLFILFDFRLQGIDILPDIIGYILFASGIKLLMEQSQYFNKASLLNTFMIVLSIFSIYEAPNNVEGVNIQWGFLGPLGVLVGIASFVLAILVVYYIFMAIKDMGQRFDKLDIYDEAGSRWTQFLFLQFAGLISFILLFIPPLAMMYIIILLVLNIFYIIVVLGFMKRCQESFAGLDVD